mgnify:CR=1 FL=1
MPVPPPEPALNQYLNSISSLSIIYPQLSTATGGVDLSNILVAPIKLLPPYWVNSTSTLLTRTSSTPVVNSE